MAHFELLKNAEGKDEVRHKKVSYSDDYCQQLVLVEKGGTQFYQSGQYVFILKEGKNYGEYKLVIGNSILNQSSGRQEIDLPLKRAKDESFTVLDISDGAILLAINHEGDEAGYTNIYISNSIGKQFSLTLQYTVGDSQ